MPRSDSRSFRSCKRKFLLLASAGVIFVVFCLVLESFVRLLVYVKTDNPYFVWYGTQKASRIEAQRRETDVFLHTNQGPGYTKFHPHSTIFQKYKAAFRLSKPTFRTLSTARVPDSVLIKLGTIAEQHFRTRKDFETRLSKLLTPAELHLYLVFILEHASLPSEPIAIRINNLGFRGKDVLPDTQPNVIRIACLGASSTFGYQNEDDETWPTQLERHLQTKLPHGVEVLNMGIPHLSSSEILALFLQEVVPLKPKIVIFYEGINDVAAARSLRNVNVTYGFMDLLAKVDNSLRARILAYELIPDFISSNWDSSKISFYREKITAAFLANLGQMSETAAAEGMIFMPVSQQAQSTSVPAEAMGNFSYWDEVSLLKAKLRKEGHLPSDLEAIFLLHSTLMSEEKALSSRLKLRYVDGIQALDNQREHLTSWVHLDAEGNRLLAEAIAGEILCILGSECKAVPASEN